MPNVALSHWPAWTRRETSPARARQPGQAYLARWSIVGQFCDAFCQDTREGEHCPVPPCLDRDEAIAEMKGTGFFKTFSSREKATIDKAADIYNGCENCRGVPQQSKDAGLMSVFIDRVLTEPRSSLKERPFRFRAGGLGKMAATPLCSSWSAPRDPRRFASAILGRVWVTASNNFHPKIKFKIPLSSRCGMGSPCQFRVLGLCLCAQCISREN